MSIEELLAKQKSSKEDAAKVCDCVFSQPVFHIALTLAMTHTPASIHNQVRESRPGVG